MLEIQFSTAKLYKRRLTCCWSRIFSVKWWKRKHLVPNEMLQACICNESTQIQEENRLMQPEARKIQRAMD